MSFGADKIAAHLIFVQTQHNIKSQDLLLKCNKCQLANNLSFKEIKKLVCKARSGDVLLRNHKNNLNAQTQKYLYPAPLEKSAQIFFLSD